jgi:mannose-6-phosphate isomerase-like protein (cupin superfamily)
MSIMIIKHSDSEWLSWREGVASRVWSSAQIGANSLHMGEQKIQPTFGVPEHWHYYEEHLTVYGGEAEVTVDGEKVHVEGPATLIFPPRSSHGFMNVGTTELHIIGASPWAVHETLFTDDPTGVITRAWEPGFGSRRRRMTASGDSDLV